MNCVSDAGLPSQTFSHFSFESFFLTLYTLLIPLHCLLHMRIRCLLTKLQLAADLAENVEIAPREVATKLHRLIVVRPDARGKWITTRSANRVTRRVLRRPTSNTSVLEAKTIQCLNRRREESTRTVIQAVP